MFLNFKSMLKQGDQTVRVAKYELNFDYSTIYFKLKSRGKNSIHISF